MSVCARVGDCRLLHIVILQHPVYVRGHETAGAVLAMALLGRKELREEGRAGRKEGRKEGGKKKGTKDARMG